MKEVRAVVGYIGKDDEDGKMGKDPDRIAHEHFLQRELGFDIVEIPFLYENHFSEERELLQIARQNDLLATIFVTQPEYEIPEELERLTSMIREEYGISVPIIVFKGRELHKEQMIEIGTNTYYASGSTQVAVSDFIRDRKTRLSETDKAKRRIAQPEIDALLQAYNANYDDEHLLSTPDDNTKIVAEYIRCRLLPPIAVKQEFDKTLEKTPTFNETPQDTFQTEIEKIQSMSDEKRIDFSQQLPKEPTKELLPTGEGNEKIEIKGSMGSEVIAFCIDTESLLSVISGGYGNHNVAKNRTLDAIDLLNIMKNKDIIDESEKRIINGYIHTKIKGFQTPILTLLMPQEASTDKLIEDMRKVGQHIISERKYIPVDTSGRIICKDYIVENK